MPIIEIDPWRTQYFENVACPDDVDIPTDDGDAWVMYPDHRKVYDKLFVALSQGMTAAPHGVVPPSFPVFAKPIVNLKGMGAGSRVLATRADYDAAVSPGLFWMPMLTGDHVSTDVAVVRGRPQWWRHTTGEPLADGMFDRWIVHADARSGIEAYCGEWIARVLPDYTGLLNLETIGGRIIEVHLRFADQWPDLYGEGWVESAVKLYAEGTWDFPDIDRRTGWSLPLFGRHGERYRHPPADLVERVRAMPGVSSVQITFHEEKPPEAHAMPPGGFRLGIVNAVDLAGGLKAREALAEGFPKGTTLNARVHTAHG
ncbi:MAG: hypothetical protein U1E46_15425 [Hyphomicrobiales bacterium]